MSIVASHNPRTISIEALICLIKLFSNDLYSLFLKNSFSLLGLLVIPKRDGFPKSLYIFGFPFFKVLVKIINRIINKPNRLKAIMNTKFDIET